MNWLYYLLEANLYLGIFYIAYYAFLKKETWYTLNRAYLLLSCVAAFILPLIQVGALKPAEAQITAISYTYAENPVIIPTVKAATAGNSFTWHNGLTDLYFTGMGVLLMMLIIRIYKLIKLAQSNSSSTCANYKLVHLEDTNTAFSFFNLLFIGTGVSAADTIIRHELVHIRQKHSIDILFLELLKIINWFSPFIYLLQASLKEVHEYIADEKTAITAAGPWGYSEFLVNNAYGMSGLPVTHSFYNNNLLKKRIIMLNQKRSGNLSRLKYLVALPVCAGAICASTLAFSKNYVLVNLFPKNADTGRMAPPVVANQAKLPSSPLPPVAPGRMVVFAAPKSPRETTGKGYQYAEGGNVVNGKAYLNVIIYEKDGTHKQYYKSRATAEEIKLLKDKYGYTFPAGPNYSHIAPPAPPVNANGDSEAPAQPVSPALPANTRMNNVQPLAPGEIPATPVKAAETLTVTMEPQAQIQIANSFPTPVIVVNGTVYRLKKTLKKGDTLYVNSDSTNAVVYSGKDLEQAIIIYGSGAKNGVIFAHGKTSVEVK